MPASVSPLSSMPVPRPITPVANPPVKFDIGLPVTVSLPGLIPVNLMPVNLMKEITYLRSTVSSACGNATNCSNSTNCSNATNCRSSTAGRELHT